MTRVLSFCAPRERKRLLSVLLLCLLVASAPEAEAQQFAGAKMKIYPRHPSRIILPARRISIQFTSQKPMDEVHIKMAESGLAEALRQSYSDLVIEKSGAEIEIRCKVNELSATANRATRTKIDYRWTGPKRGTNSSGTRITEMLSGGDREYTFVDEFGNQFGYEFGYANVNYDVIAVIVPVTASYEVVDAKSGLVLDSETIDSTYSYDQKDLNAPDARLLQLWALNQLVETIAVRFRFTSPQEEVRIPGGKLKEEGKLILLRRFEEARQRLEALPAFTNDKDESLRLYSLGLAYEMMAHETGDFAQGRKDLEEAVKLYERARDRKPGEKEFWWASGRAAYMAWRYRNAEEWLNLFEERRKQLIEGRITAQEASAALQHREEKKLDHLVVWRGAEALTNDTVIDWVKAGVPEKIIRATIRTKGANRFDFSRPERERLQQSGVSDNIFLTMWVSNSARRRASQGR